MIQKTFKGYSKLKPYTFPPQTAPAKNRERTQFVHFVLYVQTVVLECDSTSDQRS